MTNSISLSDIKTAATYYKGIAFEDTIQTSTRTNQAKIAIPAAFFKKNIIPSDPDQRFLIVIIPIPTPDSEDDKQ